MAILGVLLQFFYSQLFVTPPYPTHDFTGQTVIVTGSNTGLGLEAARHFARLNCARLILAVRTRAKGEKAKESILASTKRTADCVEVWDLDLSSTASVKAFAARAQQLDRLDVLVENAGVLSSEKFIATAEGNELGVQTNVISTFLLALLLLPKMRETAHKFSSLPHLVIVTSEVHHLAAFKEKEKDDIYAELNNEKAYAQAAGDRYNVTKLLELLLIRELTKQTSPPPVITGVNPGFCYSDFLRDATGITSHLMAGFKWLMARTTEVGSRTLVAGACAGEGSHGKYMADCVNQEAVGWLSTEDGAKLQRRVYEQTLEVLEKIEPGISKTI